MGDLPVDIVLIRHGESEGNLADEIKSHPREYGKLQGAQQAAKNLTMNKHTSRFRLTDEGRKQAKITGEFLQDTFGTFDRHYCSEYVRARETAAALNLGAEWSMDFFLREQDLGLERAGNFVNTSSITLRNAMDSDLERRECDEFYYTPNGGESIANTCLRASRVLNQLRRECSGLKVCIVLHGAVMWSFRILIERLNSKQYRQMKEHGLEKNFCQILHYTRRDPHTGVVGTDFSWSRSFVPWNQKLSQPEWKKVKQLSYSDEELIGTVTGVAQMVNNRQDELPKNFPTEMPNFENWREDVKEKLRLKKEKEEKEGKEAKGRDKEGKEGKGKEGKEAKEEKDKEGKEKKEKGEGEEDKKNKEKSGD